MRQKRLALIISAALLLLLLVPMPSSAVTVVIRYDDCSELSPTWLESGLIDLFRECRITATFAVIPYDHGVPLGINKVRMLRQGIWDGTISVALHGFTHVGSGPFGEFHSMSRKEQAEKLFMGRIMLEKTLGESVTTFVPPGNDYNADTLSAMHQSGLNCLSASCFGVTGNAGNISFSPKQ